MQYCPPSEALSQSDSQDILSVLQYLNITAVAVEVHDMALCPSVNGCSYFRVCCFRVQVVK